MASINVNAMVEYALSFQGIPYVYGGNGTAAQCYKWTQGSSCSVHKKGVKYTGYDCSGFVTKVLSKYGISMPRTTSAMQSWNPGSYGQKLGPSSAIKRGDVLLYSGHVTLAISSTRMVHARKCGTNICVSDIYRTGMTKIFRFNDSGSSSSGGSSGGSTSKTKEEQCFEFYKKKGCTTEAACGILGNIKGESNFSTTVRNPSSGATGLCQWLGSRLTNLKNKANREGKKWDSLDFQLDFSWYEFSGKECKPWMDKWGSLDKFKNLRDVEAATLAWEKIFERSGGQGNSKRIQYAKEFYNKFKNYQMDGGSGGGNSNNTTVNNNILCSPSANVTQMKNWAKSKKATDTFINNAQYFYDYGKKMGINPTLAYAQYAWETGYGQYKGQVKESMKNTCGLKNSDNTGFATFSSWNQGIEAHIDHLGLYAGGINYPRSGSPDPKHFQSLYGKYKTIDAMGKAWAGGETTYANNLKNLMKEIQTSAGGSSNNSNNTEGTKPSPTGKKVFLDPGHGGTDSGAVGNNLKEKDINLAVGLKIKSYLEERGVSVRMSRETDMAVNLSNRPKMANDWGADCYLSIHCNSASSNSAQGVETYYYASASTLAQAVQTQILANKDLYNKDRGVKKENFCVIRESKMMSALVELAFINNASDAALLKNKQDGFALACAKGIIQYLGCSWDNTGQKPDGWEQGAVGEYDPATKYIGQVYNVGSDTLNVRTGAGTGNSIIEKIKSGTKVNVYEVLSNGWLRVKTPSGKIGYVSGNYIKKVADAPGKPQPKYMYYVYACQSSSKFEADTKLEQVKELGYSNAKIETRSL